MQSSILRLHAYHFLHSVTEEISEGWVIHCIRNLNSLQYSSMTGMKVELVLRKERQRLSKIGYQQLWKSLMNVPVKKGVLPVCRILSAAQRISLLIKKAQNIYLRSGFCNAIKVHSDSPDINTLTRFNACWLLNNSHIQAAFPVTMEIASLISDQGDFTGWGRFLCQDNGKNCFWFQISLRLKIYPAGGLIAYV